MLKVFNDSLFQPTSWIMCVSPSKKDAGFCDKLYRDSETES